MTQKMDQPEAPKIKVTAHEKATFSPLGMRCFQSFPASEVQKERIIRLLVLPAELKSVLPFTLMSIELEHLYYSRSSSNNASYVGSTCVLVAHDIRSHDNWSMASFPGWCKLNPKDRYDWSKETAIELCVARCLVQAGMHYMLAVPTGLSDEDRCAWLEDHHERTHAWRKAKALLWAACLPNRAAMIHKAMERGAEMVKEGQAEFEEEGIINNNEARLAESEETQEIEAQNVQISAPEDEEQTNTQEPMSNTGSAAESEISNIADHQLAPEGEQQSFPAQSDQQGVRDQQTDDDDEQITLTIAAPVSRPMSRPPQQPQQTTQRKPTIRQ